uniref:Alpha-1,3-mannosyl-glycoprotein 2-beta-N-acetylglucosaminyltransferase n=1 Tax=Globodera rostochiensis TaxID=31243 RepID=A0A914IAX0_GLORO
MHYSLRQLNKDGLNLDVQNRAADFLEQRLDQLEDLLRNEQRELGELSRRIDAKKIAWQHPIPVLVFVCNRLEAARAHLQKLIRYRRYQKELFPIIVSQDCDNKALQEMVQREFGSEVQHVKHISSESARLKPPPEHRQFSTYYKIARHYKLGLTHVFDNVNFTSVIITEDDLDVAPDFFDFFLATRPLLEVDRSLFCVSAWNDNGKKGLVDLSFGPSLLYRSDFFPGLGWMITRHFWEELRPKWPRAFWDDFLREPEQRKNRSCIRPEISRTAMTEFGRIGASKGLFFNRHLKRIFLNQITVNFTRLDLGSLQQQRYDDKFLGRVYSAPKIGIKNILAWSKSGGGDHRIEYASMDDFVTVALKVGIMADSKAGVPRTAYRGIVTCFLNGTRLFIAPPQKWNGYDRKWEAPRSILDGMDT